MFQIQPLLPSKNLDRHGTWPQAFDQEEIEKIQFFEKILDFSQGTVGMGDQAQANTSVRDNDVAWFHMDDNTQWLWQKIGNMTSTANYDLFLHDIEALQGIQYSIYKSDSISGGGHYNWHVDASRGGYVKYDRKISGIIMLSDDNEYEGGKLEFDPHSSHQIGEVNLKKGDIFFFDSQMPHRVTPVTEGVRKTLVFWAIGKSQL